MISMNILIRPISLLILVAGLTVILSNTASAVTVTEVFLGGTGSSYALDANGDVWVWGDFLGQKYVHPTKVPFIDQVIMISPSSSGDAVVLKEDGTVWSWGSWPATQESSYLGENSTIPVQIDITDVKYIASTPNTLYMVKTDNSLWMCGRNLLLSFDDLMHAKNTLDPIQLPISNVQKVVPTLSFVYVEKNDGSWWSWGENRDYQLNDGTNISKGSPVQMQLDNVKSVSAQSMCFGINDDYRSLSGVLALDSNGQVYGWGDNTYWVSGDSVFPTYAGVNSDGDSVGYIVSSPHPVPGMSNVREIGCGVDYYATLKKDGTIWAWGSNPECNDGQSSLDSNTPVQLKGFTDIAQIIVGDKHFLAIKKDGTIWAWGSNTHGELGNGEISANGGKPYAVQVADLYVDLSKGTDATYLSSTSTQIPTQISGPMIEIDQAETPSPDMAVTASPTLVPLPNVTPNPAPGFNFNTIAILCCLYVSAGLLTGFKRRKEL